MSYIIIYTEYKIKCITYTTKKEFTKKEIN